VAQRSRRARPSSAVVPGFSAARSTLVFGATDHELLDALAREVPEPQTIFLVPIANWSDGTAAAIP